MVVDTLDTDKALRDLINENDNCALNGTKRDERIASLLVLSLLSPARAKEACISLLINSEKDPKVAEQACLTLADIIEAGPDRSKNQIAQARTSLSIYYESGKPGAKTAFDCMNRVINKDLKRLGIGPEQRINYPKPKQQKQAAIREVK